MPGGNGVLGPYDAFPDHVKPFGKVGLQFFVHLVLLVQLKRTHVYVSLASRFYEPSR